MAKLKIILWAPFGAGNHYWGPGTSAYRLYQNKIPEECEITLVHASEQQGFFPDVYVQQVKLPTLEKRGIIAKFKYFWAARRWIKKNAANYDVFHGLSAFEYTFRPALWFQQFDKPAFIKLTSLEGGFGKSSFLSKILGVSRKRKKNSKKITGYIAISNAIADKLAKLGIPEKKIFRIPNGVDNKKFYQLDLAAKTSLRNLLEIEDIFTVCYLGGLTRNKRVLEIVMAMHEIIKEGIPIQLIIVGPDRSQNELENEIQKYIARNSISNQIKRINHTDTPELFLQVSDIFVLNSRQEGMPNSLLEAMSCGLPSIVTKVSGTEDLIVDRINGLFSIGTPTDIAKHITTLYKNKYLLKNLGKLAKETINGKYNSRTVLEHHLKLFKKYINRSNFSAS